MTESTLAPKGWSSRGYLPHFDGGPIPQTLTFRLANTLPPDVLDRWRRNLPLLSPVERQKVIRHLAEAELDRCRDGPLAVPATVRAVQASLLLFDGARYRLHAWVIMPSHVHVLLTPLPGFGVGDMLRSWKSYTARRANAAQHRAGRFWQPDYFDRFIRNERHFRVARRYIERNPVAAGLCGAAEDWPWSSAGWRKRAAAGEVESGEAGLEARAP
ncbi:MAG: REP-associated tyrosine transposase [Terriglobales bacterium]